MFIFIACFWFDFYWLEVISLIIPIIVFIFIGVFEDSKSKIFREIYEYRILVVPLGYLFLKNLLSSQF